MSSLAIQGVSTGKIGPVHHRRGRRVILLLIALAILGLGDLYATIVHARTIGMNELNPIGAYLIAAHSAAGLILWKLGTMGVTTGALMKVRHHRVAETACWMLVAVMVCLTFHWSSYNQQLSHELADVGYDAVCSQMQNQLADGAD